MPPPEAAPVPSVHVVVVVGGACVRPPLPAPMGGGIWGDPGGGQRHSQDPPPHVRRCDRDLIVMLRREGPGAPPGPVAVTRFVGPEPCDLRPGAPPADIDVEVARPQAFAVELPRGPQGFGLSLWGGRDLNMGVYVRRLRDGGPAQRCGRIQVSDQLLAINGAPTAGMTHAQALACIRGGGSPLRLLLRRGHGAPPTPPPGGVLALCISSSCRGEPCFCLVGRRAPGGGPWGGLHP